MPEKICNRCYQEITGKSKWYTDQGGEFVHAYVSVCVKTLKSRVRTLEESNKFLVVARDTLNDDRSIILKEKRALAEKVRFLQNGLEMSKAITEASTDSFPNDEEILCLRKIFKRLVK